MTRPEIDLDKVQERFTAAREFYLEQERLYTDIAENDEKLLITEYLDKFCDGDPDRAEIATNIARKTIEEINSFHNARASIASDVALTVMSVNLVMGALTTRAFGDAFESMDKLNDKLANALRGESETGENTDELNLEERFERGKEDAATYGQSVSQILEMSGNIILLRREALQSITEGYLTVTFMEALERTANDLSNMPRDEVLDHVWEEFAKAVVEILQEVWEQEFPVHRVKKILQIITEKFGLQKADTDPNDGTNRMLKILPLLEKQGEELELLSATLEKSRGLEEEILERLKRG